MNFTQFLKTEKLLNESYVADATESVVLGYATFVPCHIGYLYMAAKLVGLAEHHDSTPVLIIVEKDQLVRDQLPTITKCLMTHFPCLTVQIEENVVDPLHRMAQTGKAVKAIVAEHSMVMESGVFYKRLHDSDCEQHVIDMTGYKQTSMQAVKEDDFHGFRASILECSYDDAFDVFSRLREVV